LAKTLEPWKALMIETIPSSSRARRFRTHGPVEEGREYRKRPAVEASFAFMKTQFGMTVNKVRGLLGVSVYVLLSVLCCVLNREAAENVGRPEKALSPTFFNV